MFAGVGGFGPDRAGRGRPVRIVAVGEAECIDDVAHAVATALPDGLVTLEDVVEVAPAAGAGRPTAQAGGSAGSGRSARRVRALRRCRVDAATGECRRGPSMEEGTSMNDEDARRRVVVGVDGSPDALRAVRWAARDAARRGADLDLVAAIVWAEDRLPGIPALVPDRTGDVLRNLAMLALDEAEATAAEAAPGIVTTRREVVGFAPSVLRAAARGAEVLVVGDRGRGRIASVMAGSVAVALAAHASCPVVVVRGALEDGSAEATGPVVVGIDGTSRSDAALAFAFAEASAQGARLLAVHTWSDVVNDPYLAPLIRWELVAEDEANRLADRLAGWQEKYPEVEVEQLVARGRAAHVLLDRSVGARLVVVGSRGHGEVLGLLLDSVGNALIHGASCPVAVVRLSEET